MNDNILPKLPQKPGVYYFYNNQRKIIYIGKATSLRDRVRSYFSGPKTLRPIEEMIGEVHDIKWKITDSVLEAIILEALEIKNQQPKYNVIGKDDKSWNYLVLTKDDYPKLETIRMHEMEDSKKYLKIFGPFPKLKTRETLKILRKLFHYSTCKPNSGRPCLYRQMDQCYGVCTGEISQKDYKKRVINPLSLFLSGKKKQVIIELTKQMKKLAKDNFFEEAAVIRNQIESLKHIHDITLIDKSFFNSTFTKSTDKNQTNKIRIEGYDISNLGSTNIVGSMVVFEYGESNKSQYRKFKIKTVKGQSDVDALAEMIERRFKHDEWPRPNYILVDGGKPQLNKIKKLLNKLNIKIPIIGIAKGRDRKKNEFHLSNRTTSLTDFVKNNTNLLIQVRDEAHRFAITYQRQTRKLAKK